ncbi:MAG: GNAT family N-acetyltransferase [Candidatus Roizmanbacteria bacterium]
MISPVAEQDRKALKAIYPSLTDQTITDRLTQQADGKIAYLVLKDKGKLVSTVVLCWAGKACHPDYPDIVDLYTKESERGKGYASMLILECERVAKTRGFRKIGMAVNPERNCRAKKLYEQLGYHHDGGEPYVDGVYDGTKDWCINLVKEIGS